MVFVMKNPNLKWMMVWGTPMTMETPMCLRTELLWATPATTDWRTAKAAKARRCLETGRDPARQAIGDHQRKKAHQCHLWWSQNSKSLRTKTWQWRLEGRKLGMKAFSCSPYACMMWNIVKHALSLSQYLNVLISSHFYMSVYGLYKCPSMILAWDNRCISFQQDISPHHISYPYSNPEKRKINIKNYNGMVYNLLAKQSSTIPPSHPHVFLGGICQPFPSHGRQDAKLGATQRGKACTKAHQMWLGPMGPRLWFFLWKPPFLMRIYADVPLQTSVWNDDFPMEKASIEFGDSPAIPDLTSLVV